MSHPRGSLRDTSVGPAAANLTLGASPRPSMTVNHEAIPSAWLHDPPNSASTCRICDTSPSRPRRVREVSPSAEASKPSQRHSLRLSWGLTTTSRRVHEVTLRGQSCAGGFGAATAPMYDICAPLGFMVTAPNSSKSRRSRGALLTSETTRLTAPTEERSNRSPPRVVVVAPRPAQPLVGIVWTGGGSSGEEWWILSSRVVSSSNGPIRTFGRSERGAPERATDALQAR